MKVGDFGGDILVSVEEDLSSATNLILTFTTPTGSEIVKAGSLGVSDKGSLAANEYVRYTVEDGFLDQSGLWKVQLTVETSASSRSTDNIGFSLR